MAKKNSAPQKFIDLLSDEEIGILFKHFTGVALSVKDRPNREIRLLNVTFGKLRPVAVEALKFCKIPEEKINQYREGFNDVLAFPNGFMKPEDLKRHAKALSESTSGKRPDDVDQAMLKKLRELIPEEARGEDAQVNTTQLAEALTTNINVVVKSIQKMAKLGLVSFEDDSNDAHSLLWVRVTETGRAFTLSEPRPVRLPNSTPGPRSAKSGKYISKVPPHDKKNPRREGTWGWKSFEVVRDGMCVEAYMKGGGRPQDLAWDINHGFLRLSESVEDAAAAPASALEAPAAPSPAKVSKKKAGKEVIKQIVKKKGAKKKSK